MLIELDASLATAAGGVIKAAALRPSRQAHNLLAETERRAHEMLARAELEAARIVEAGFQDGVRAGVNVLLAPMLEMAAALEAQRAHLAQAAREHVRASMEALLARSETLGPLVELIIDAHAPRAACVVKLTLPRAAEGEEIWVRERCHALGLDAVVDIGEDTVFRMEWGSHRWESAGISSIGGFEEGVSGDAGALSADARLRLVAKALIEASQGVAAKGLRASRPDFTG